MQRADRHRQFGWSFRNSFNASGRARTASDGTTSKRSSAFLPDFSAPASRRTDSSCETSRITSGYSACASLVGTRRLRWRVNNV
jgi:hypothetical protein